MARCRGCGAEIEWIRTRAGKNMPVDPEPVFVLVCFGEGPGRFVTDEGDMISGQEVPTNDGDAEVAFVPHWATCPVAGRFKTGN